MNFWRNQKFRGWFYQTVAVLCVLLGVALLAHNTVENMQIRGIQSGFGFLNQAAGFDISESLFGYEPSQPYWKAFLTGFYFPCLPAPVKLLTLRCVFHWQRTLRAAEPAI